MQYVCLSFFMYVYPHLCVCICQNDKEGRIIDLVCAKKRIAVTHAEERALPQLSAFQQCLLSYPIAETR